MVALSNESAFSNEALTRAYFKYGLWACQALLAIGFIYIGYLKFTIPFDLLGKMWGWPGEYPPAFVRGMAILDMLGGVGVLLPVLSRVMPNSAALRGLSILAAFCCTLLQVCAILFHFLRGEVPVLGLNDVLLVLAGLVLLGFITKPWGASQK